MKSRKAIALFGLSALALAISAYFYCTRLEPEPVYEGKTVSLWLEQYTKQSTWTSHEDKAEARRAVNKIGPRAIPFIIHKLKQNDSPLRNKYRNIWPKLPFFLKKLLPRAEPIDFGVDDAALAFLNAGTNSIPLLMPRLHALNPAVREAVMSALADFPEDAISTDQMVSICQTALADSDPGVRSCAAEAVERLGPVASNAIPTLIASLETSEVSRFQTNVAVHARPISALARMGALASSAVPVLSNIMATSTSAPDTLFPVAFAVWQISSNQDLVLPVLTNVLAANAYSTYKVSYEQQMAIQILGEMGPKAKEAFPFLLQTLRGYSPSFSRSSPDIGSELTNALLKIDPIAAAKAIEERPQYTNAPSFNAPLGAGERGF